MSGCSVIPTLVRGFAPSVKDQTWVRGHGLHVRLPLVPLRASARRAVRLTMAGASSSSSHRGPRCAVLPVRGGDLAPDALAHRGHRRPLRVEHSVGNAYVADITKPEDRARASVSWAPRSASASSSGRSSAACSARSRSGCPSTSRRALSFLQLPGYAFVPVAESRRRERRSPIDLRKANPAGAPS